MYSTAHAVPKHLQVNSAMENSMRSGAFRISIESLLAEDVPHGDLTTESLGISGLAGRMVFSARDPMVLAEAETAAAILELAGSTVTLHASAGDQLAPGALILTAEGHAGSLHRGWKAAQTLIEIWSGVATAAHAIIEAATAVSPDIVVACTRKTVPGTKQFAVQAIRAGGAVIHRLGLSETILVFPEHLAFMGGVPLTEAVQRLRRAAPEKKLVMEATSIEDALAGAKAGFDIIQAEKFAPEKVAELAGTLREKSLRPQIAAAGGITAANAAAYARAGADILVTSSPYFARPCDVQVRIMPET
jgi:molybdenum transport protein